MSYRVFCCKPGNYDPSEYIKKQKEDIFYASRYEIAAIDMLLGINEQSAQLVVTKEDLILIM